MQQEREHEKHTVISVINRHQQHQSAAPIPTTEVQGEDVPGANSTTRADQRANLHRERNRCPHHPRERLVRFDPAGQAWCDRMDCWDCYRLMKIGEALGYGCVIDRGGQRLLDQGMQAWSAFVLSQRPFPVVSATQEAITLCQKLGVEVPDLSGEVKHLVEVH